MLVGVPKEIKDNEYRVGIVPSTVRELTENGHRVLIERQAGAGAGFGDVDYQGAGGEIVSDGDAVFGHAELIVKVKEPFAAERKKLSRGQVLFTYLHLAPDRAQTEDLMANRRDCDRLRNSDLPGGHSAASDADVRGCRPHGAACRRALARKREWWTRGAPCRRAGRCHGNRRHPRRWCRRGERGHDCFRHGS
jgi:Alanine dehydrogenase/PNT, N-terminal domain